MSPQFWHKVSLIALYLAAPVSWGLVVLFLSNRIEAFVRAHGKRKGLHESQTTMPPLEYHI